MQFSSSSSSTRSPLQDPLLLQPSSTSSCDNRKKAAAAHAELARAAQASAAAADSFIQEHSVSATAAGEDEFCWHIMEQDDEEDEEQEPGHHHHHHHQANNQTASSSSSWIMIWLGTTSNLCSATLGCGVLALPAACAQTGLVIATILTLVAACATIYSIHLLVQACCTYSLYSYESLTLHCLGNRWRRAVEFFMLLFCQGTAVAYLIAVCDILQQSHLLLFGNSRTWTLIIVWILIELPLSLNRRMTHLQMASAIGIAAIFTLIIAASVHLLDDQTMEHKDQQQYHKNWSSMQDILWPNHGNIISALTACPIILFAFSCQVNVCAIFQELPSVVVVDNNSNNNNRRSRSRQQQQQQYDDGDQENMIHDNNASTTDHHHGHDDDDDARTQHQQQQPDDIQDENMQKQRRLMSVVTVSAIVLCTLLYASISAIVLFDFGPEATAMVPNLLQLYHLHGGGGHDSNNSSTTEDGVGDSEDNNSGNSHDNDNNSNSTSLMQVAAMAMAVAVVVAFPLNIFPARVTLAGIFCTSSSTTSNHSSSQTRRERNHGITVGGSSLTANENLTAALLEDYTQETNATMTTKTSLEPTEDNNISTTTTRRKNNRAGQEGGAAAAAAATAARPGQPLSVHQASAQRSSSGNDGGEEENSTEIELSCFNHVALTLLLTGSALGMALVVPDISTVFSILGGTASSFLGFIIPGLLGLKLHEHNGGDRTAGYLPVVLSWLLILFGIVMGILTTAATIYSLIHK